MSLTSLGIFRWLREVADSSSVERQEHRAVLENRAQQERLCSRLPTASCFSS